MAINTGDQKLPGLNFRAPARVDDLEFWDEQVSLEITTRQKIAAGYRQLPAMMAGILDLDDPANVAASETTRPLIVTINPVDNLTIDVNAGILVAPSGNFVNLTVSREQLAMARNNIGDVNVVFVEYFTENPVEFQKLTRFQTLLSLIRRRPLDSRDHVQVALLTDFQDPAQFSPDRIGNIVVVAVVNVIQGSSGVELDIDLTNLTYAFNRPWYSTVDIRHRSEVGTGSSSTPHSIGFNDLSAGNLTIYQQLLSHGIVLSKDVSFPNQPGQQCIETIPLVNFLVDTTGTVTVGSKFNRINAQYAILQGFPVNLGAIYESTDAQNAIAADVVPGKNILVIAPNETVPANGIKVEFREALALSPPVTPTSNSLAFGQPNPEHELIISSGKAFAELQDPVLPFDPSGPIAKNFQVLFDGRNTGQLIQVPQLLLLATKLNAVGTGITEIGTTLIGPARLRVGLTRANAIVSMQIQIELNGTDSTGSALSETVTFSGATWLDQLLPAAAEESNQFVLSTGIFSTLDSIQVLTRLNDGPNSTIIIYADIDPFITEDVRESCPAANVFWDGLSVNAISDIRPVNYQLDKPTRYTPIETEAEGILASPYFDGLIVGPDAPVDQSRLLLAEDFRRTRYLSTVDVDFERFPDGIKTAIPGPAISNTTPLRKKYRSKAIGIPEGYTNVNNFGIIVHGVQNPTGYAQGALRFRVSEIITPLVWNAWAIVDPPIAGSNNLVFQFTIGNFVHKFQIEVFGESMGVSVFALKPNP